jgi:ribosomal protein S24E
MQKHIPHSKNQTLIAATSKNFILECYDAKFNTVMIRKIKFLQGKTKQKTKKNEMK